MKDDAMEGIYPLVETKNLNEDMIEDVEMKNDNDEQEFDDIILDHECNTEEEEEDELNRHSENESSIEGEDIAKDLESGMDYSFEDEDVDDIENIEEVQNEVSKVSSSSQEDQTAKSSDDSGEIKTSFIQEEEKEEKPNLKEETPENSTEDIKAKTETIEEKIVSNVSDIPKEEIILNVEKTEIKTEDMKLEEIKSEPMTPAGNEVDGNAEAGASIDTTSREWTREEDKIILQTFQHESGLEQTFETASLQLPNRSKPEVRVWLLSVLL